MSLRVLAQLVALILNSTERLMAISSNYLLPAAVLLLTSACYSGDPPLDSTEDSTGLGDSEGSAASGSPGGTSNTNDTDNANNTSDPNSDTGGDSVTDATGGGDDTGATDESTGGASTGGASTGGASTGNASAGDDTGTTEDSPEPGPERIICLGDSITEAGFQHYAYRYYLWQRIVADGIDYVDFVGSKSGTYSGAAPDQSWDSEHDGHWGAKADEVLNGGLPYGGVGSIQDWAPAYQPTIALIQLGTNDCRGGQSPESTLADLAGIIDTLRASVPDVLILVAQVIQSKDAAANSCLATLNGMMPGWAAGLATEDSPILVVDQWSALDPLTDLADDYHTNESGGQKMADRWYETLRDHLL